MKGKSRSTGTLKIKKIIFLNRRIREPVAANTQRTKAIKCRICLLCVQLNAPILHLLNAAMISWSPFRITATGGGNRLRSY